ncbi:MAG: HK97 gp10 family phage protein [Euryarchaeota archaeon]|nr:HK97 gp10 family phage protein [Euryarchaeota archaeon]
MSGNMFEFNIKGMQEAKDSIKKKYDPEKIKQALILGGLAIEAEAKDTAQVDTGQLRASYTTNWDGSGMQSAPVQPPAKPGDGVSQPFKGFGDIAVVRIGSNVNHAVFIEYGTRSIEPYMTVHKAALKLQNRIKDMLKKCLDES